MKRYLIILLLAFCCSLSASELYACDGTIYETSLAWQSGNTVAGYSSTELDYCAGIYYDPATWGRFSEGNWAVENPRMISDAYTQGYGSSVAAQINYNYLYPINGQYYNVDTQHYIISYYQVYVPYWGGGWYWYDPWQLGFASDWGTYDGPDYYYGIYYASYWVANPQAAGNTFHTIIYSGQNQCPSGQAFTPTGLSCTNPPPPPPPPDPEPPKPTVKIQSVGFKEDAPIKRITDNSLIDDVTWMRGRDNDDKYPVAYKKGTTPIIFGTFKVTNPVAGISTVTIQMKIGSKVYAEIPNVDVSSAGDVPFDNVTLSDPLPNSNVTRMTKYDFDWEMKLDGNNKWFSAGESGAHRIHWLPESVTTPTGPRFRRNPRQFDAHEQGLYNVGLLHSSGALGNGSDDPTTIATTITKHLDSVIRYNPGFRDTDINPLDVFKEDNPERECGDNATILAALLKNVGVDNTIRTTGGGNTVSKVWHLFPYSGNDVSGRFVRPAKIEPAVPGKAEINLEQNPYFRYHATVIVGSNSYDPSYGTVDDAVHITKAIDLNNNCLTGSVADGARVFTDYRVDEPIARPGELSFNSCGTPSVRASTVSGVSAPWQTSVSASDYAYVTMKNTGTDTWRASDGYQLGFRMGSGGNLFDAGSFPLPNDVAPDQEVTFAIPITQGGYWNSGMYDFQWQMMQNTDWFGDSTSIVSVYVIGVDQCNQDNQDACMWQGGYWNAQNCSCQGIY